MLEATDLNTRSYCFDYYISEDLVLYMLRFACSINMLCTI